MDSWSPANSQPPGCGNPEAWYDAVVGLDLDFFDQRFEQWLLGLVVAVGDDVRDVVTDLLSGRWRTVLSVVVPGRTVEGNFSLGEMFVQGAIGAVVGGVMGGLGSVGFAAARAGVAGAFGGADAKAAVQAGASAARKEAGAIVGGKITGGMFGRGGAQAAEGAAGGAG